MRITLTEAAAKTLPELINEFITRKTADEYHRLCQQKFDEAECRTYPVEFRKKNDTIQKKINKVRSPKAAISPRCSGSN